MTNLPVPTPEQWEFLSMVMDASENGTLHVLFAGDVHDGTTTVSQAM